jgi:cytochrome c peroxidase
MGSRCALSLWLVLSAAGCVGSQADEGATAEALTTTSTSATPDTKSASLSLTSRDDSGTLETIAQDAAATTLAHPGNHPFFKSFGTNDRACIHCHVPAAGWTITPDVVQLRFTNPLETDKVDCLRDPYQCAAEKNDKKFGLDPIFRVVDGANSPNADVSTTAKRLKAYSMLLDKAVIRIGLGIPATAEFTLDAVEDPYHYASAKELSLFRRPLPTTNLGTGAGGTTLSTVMWDGRENVAGQAIVLDLNTQANDATLLHAQALQSLSTADRAAIVTFETSLHTAQLVDEKAGRLDVDGANGGPLALQQQAFYLGINDVLAGDSKTGALFTSSVFDLYQGWASGKGAHDLDADDDQGHADRDGKGFGRGRDCGNDGQATARASIVRGEALFNTKAIAITGVAGLNDALNKPTIAGTCTTCHDSPNYGHHSVALPLNIGIADASRRTSDLPLYTLRNKTTGAKVQTTDPGRALVTGHWADVGKFKGPILRGLAGRAPYFHNGSAAALGDVVDFYDTRFGVGFTQQEKRDLVAFLKSL